MRDMLPRKTGTIVTDIKKGLKDSIFSNGMNPSTSPALLSPTTSGGSNSPSHENNEGLNFKSRSESPLVIMKNNEEKSMNSSANLVSAMLTNSCPPSGVKATTTSSIVTSPISSPGIMPLTRTKSSPQSHQNKLRRNHSTEPKQKNQIFDFDPPRHESQSSSENFCANNNNNSKHREKSPFNLRRVCMKAEDRMHASRTPSTNSASDLSPSSLTTNTDDQTTAPTPRGQNLDQIGSILGNSPMYVDDKTMEEALNNIEGVPDPNRAFSDLVDTFPDAGGDLGLEGDTGAPYAGDFVSTSEAFLFVDGPLRPSQAELSSLEGAGFPGGVREHQMSPVSIAKVSTSSTVTTATCAVTQAMHGLMTTSASALAASVSSPTFQPDPANVLTSTSPFNPKFSPPDGAAASNQTGKTQSGKSHLQDILGVTDTNRLKNMSRPIDSVPYKSPTTTSYSTGMKPHSTPIIPSSPCSMAPPQQHRLHANMQQYKPRPIMYDSFRGNPRTMPPYMEPGMNAPWNRGSPGHLRTSPGQLRSPTFPTPYADTSSASVNPMSCLQSTVDSIPAVPLGTSEPSTPVMGPPLRSPHPFDGTPPPGGRMRPPPSPSVTNNDKRCVSADSVAAPTVVNKKSVNKRERTRSADSREDDKKELSGPKTKRRKSRSRDDNSGGKKSADSKALGRSNSAKGDCIPRLESALSGLLDVQSHNPFLYIFNTEVANEAANTVNSNKVPDIILFHQSFLGNCKLGPSRPQASTFDRPPNAPPSITMPTTNRSPTDVKPLKQDGTATKSPKIETPLNLPENVPGINLRDTKPPNLPPMSNDDGRISNPEVFPPQSAPNVTSYNGEQEELSAEKRKNREDKLGKLRKMEKMLLKHETSEGYNVQRGPGWTPGQQPPMNFPMGQHMDKSQPGMKEAILTQEGVFPAGQPMTQERAEWFNLLQQEYNAEKRRKQEGEVPSRPPPPYQLNGSQHRWMGPDGYNMEPRMPIDSMNPRFQRMPPGHRPVMRMPQDPRLQGNYHRLSGPRGPYPNAPNNRMPVYDPYMVQPGMMGPSGPRGPPMSNRLPPAGMRQPGVNENYPFSEQLMKQASYYNREGGIPYDQDPAMLGDWQGNGGPDGSQRLSHMPGATSPTLVGPNMINPMEMESRLTPAEMRMPTPRGYEMGPYHEMHRYDPCTLGSPTVPMEMRMRGPPVGAGSMVDAIARRGGQRPPDLNLNSQIPPGSPMGYHVRGPLPSPNIMTSSIGPRYSNHGDLSHQPQLPHVGPRSPLQSPGMSHPQYLQVGPTSAGMEQPQVMIGGPPHSAGPMSNPPSDWTGPSPGLTGTPTSNTPMMHHMMTSDPGMTSQPGMMSQPGISHPHMMNNRMPNAGKHGQSTLSIMMNRINSFKMPEKSPLYQEAVKDTASPPPLNHEPPPLSHGTMPGGMARINAPGHPPTYDGRMGRPRMAGPPMNESFQGYPAGHPSPLQGPPLSGGNVMMNMVPDSMPPPSDYPGFDLTGILPSERPSQTISYLPPETNEQYSSPGWTGEGIRPQLMPSGPMYPPGPNRPLI